MCIIGDLSSRAKGHLAYTQRAPTPIRIPLLDEGLRSVAEGLGARSATASRRPCAACIDGTAQFPPLALSNLGELMAE
jgi:hypothetical protein